MLRQRMRCDAPPFSPADYDHIMQCAEKKPRDKVLKDLTDKYRTSQKRIYQIWRGEEKNRVAWNQPIHMPTASLSNINVVGSGPSQRSKAKMFPHLQNWKNKYVMLR